MRKKFLFISMTIFLSFIAYLFFCVKPSATNSKDARLQKGSGELKTSDGYTFPYQFFPAQSKGACVIYLPGLGGKTSYRGTKSGGYTLAPILNNAGFSFLGCDYYRFTRGTVVELIKIGQSRGESGLIAFPSIDGKESGAENIVRNEIKSLLESVKESPIYDMQKSIYLIGDSIGSWYSLVAVRYFPEEIKGVIFLSPGILSDWPEWSQPEKYPNLDAKGYFDSLIKVFGTRPALAIGGKKDIIWPQQSKESAWDSAQFLRSKIGPNVELMEVSSPGHGWELIEESKGVRNKIAEWLTNKNRAN